jgi:hypothetical protein
MEGLFLKRGNDQVRVPERVRPSREDSTYLRNQSVGDALRKARKDLIIRQIVFGFILFAIAVALTVVAYMGYFGKLIQYLMDRLV